MDTTIPYVRVKQKYQVTIPTSVRNEIDIHEGDTLEAKVQNGQIVLTPQILSNRMKWKRNARSLLDLIGGNKGSGLWKSAEEVDDYIRKLRDEWED